MPAKKATRVAKTAKRATKKTTRRTAKKAGAGRRPTVPAQPAPSPVLIDPNALFTGHYRKAAKTSIYRDASGAVAPSDQTDIATLLNFGAAGALPSDAQMRANYPDLEVDPAAPVDVK